MRDLLESMAFTVIERRQETSPDALFLAQRQWSMGEDPAGEAQNFTKFMLGLEGRSGAI